MRKVWNNFAMVVLGLALAPSFSWGENSEDLRIISVRGEGEISVKPDMVRIELQVFSKGKDAKEAQERNAKEMARVHAILLKEKKLDPKDVQTSGFFLQPNYEYSQNGKQRFVGYDANHRLSVIYRDVEKVGDLLDKVVEGGKDTVGIHIGQISFDTSKREEYEVQALEKAMQNASARAQALAKFSKKTLHGVRRISDSSVSFQPYITSMRAGRSAMMMEKSNASPTEISQGEIKVNAGVAVDFDM